jgi:hypothetical protein
MTIHSEKAHRLPSGLVSYAYTVAMHFSQQLELNLRAILYTTDYHGWGAGVEFDESQRKRFKDTETFIDKATCGLIIEKLKAVGVIEDRRAFRIFERACTHRNKLAHFFLAEQNFNEMTKQKEMSLIRRLHEMTMDLYQALLISRSVRNQVERLAEESHTRLQAMFREIEGAGYDNPNRNYATKKRRR